MRVTSAAIYEICSTFNMMLRRISSTEHTSVVTQKELLHSPGMTTECRLYQTGKASRGLKGNPEQVAVWIESIRVCSHLAMAIDGMYNSNAASAATTVKHNEEGSKRRELERERER